MSSSKKDLSISFIRMLSCCLIISCHIFQYYGKLIAFWLNVGVPIFLVVSGWLYAGKTITNITQWLAKNAKKILLPVYLYLLLFFFIRAIITKDFDFHLIEIREAFFLTEYPGGLEHLWFIIYILLCYLVTPFLQSFWENVSAKSKTSFILCISLILFCLFTQVINQVYMTRFDSAWVFCYIAGYYFRKIADRTEYKTLYKIGKLIVILWAIVMCALRIYAQYILESQSWRTELVDRYSHSFLGIALFLLLYDFLGNRCTSALRKIQTVLGWSDKYSYKVYISHSVFILGQFSLLGLTPYKTLNITIILALSVLCALMLDIFESKTEILFKKYIFQI